MSKPAWPIRIVDTQPTYETVVAWGRPLFFSEQHYGYFEQYSLMDHELYHCEGGLWYNPDTLELIDYDGVFELPAKVKQILLEFGFNLSE